MSLILTQPITGPSAWKAADAAQRQDEWLRPLSAEAIAALDAALAGLEARGLRFPHFTKEDFPLDALAPELARWSEDLENGLGFVVARGIPVERYTPRAICLARFRPSVISATRTRASTKPTSTCPTTPIPPTWWACCACARPRRAACPAS